MKMRVFLFFTSSSYVRDFTSIFDLTEYVSNRPKTSSKLKNKIFLSHHSRSLILRTKQRISSRLTYLHYLPFCLSSWAHKNIRQVPPTNLNIAFYFFLKFVNFMSRFIIAHFEFIRTNIYILIFHVCHVKLDAKVDQTCTTIFLPCKDPNLVSVVDVTIRTIRARAWVRASFFKEMRVLFILWPPSAAAASAEQKDDI